jgi:hypothetical protein
MWEFLGRRVAAGAGILVVMPLVALTLTACDDAYGKDHKTASSRVVAPVESDVSLDPQTAATPVSIELFAPENGDNAGIAGVGWLVDMELTFAGKSLHQTGFTSFQLSGPGAHQNIAPFPKPAVLGQDESNPGLVVFCTTSTNGPGANLAGLFNITGVTNQTSSETELWATWIVAAPACGTSGTTRLWVAVVDDLNHNGIYDDAPNAVADLNGDGKINGKDLQLLGVASNIVTTEFNLHP